MVYDNFTIDAGNPVDWTHPTMQLGARPVAWWLAIPGLAGGAKLHDLMSPPDLRVGNHGTLTNGPAWRPASRPGSFGELVLTGATERITLTKSANWFTGDFSIIARIVLTIADSADRQIFRLSDGVAANAIWFYYNGSTTGKFKADDFNSASSAQTLAGNTTPTAGSEYVVGYTKAGTTQTLWLNGVSDGTRTYSGSRDSSEPTTVGLGGQFGGSQGLQGSLLSIAVYSRALPAAEVAALYDLGRRGYPGVLRRMRRTAYSFPSSFVVVPSPVTEGEAELTYLTEGAADLSSSIDGVAELTSVTEGVAELE